jgi:proline racemase
MKQVRVIDSHTGGEPTRVVIEGGPDLGGGSIAARLAVLREHHDTFRSALVNEPRGSDVLVGALVEPAADPSCLAGVIFFNNVGYLGMCGHGVIGVVKTLVHLGRMGVGECRLETPVGKVTASVHEDGLISVTNVPSWRKAQTATVHLPGHGPFSGDVAWGGNWFFLVEHSPLELTLANLGELSGIAWKIRQALNAEGFPEVDHVELFGPAQQGGDSRNFVLCPGKAYDRSPCGTGTSAKLACLAADGKLREGYPWVQEGILGTTFTGRYRWIDRARGEILPTITGCAYITGEATLLLDERDPFCWGIR